MNFFKMSGIDVSKLNRIRHNEKDSTPVLAVFHKEIFVFNHGELSDSKKERFYSGLSMLLTSGIDLKSALELIAGNQKIKKDEALFIKIKEQIVAGFDFANALKSTKRFSVYEEFSIRIGEQSGKLLEVLKGLSEYFSKKIKQRRQIINALSYPILVLLTAIGTVIFMMHFIVPMFSDVFSRFKGDLPLITKIVIKASEIVSSSVGWFLLLLFLLIFVIVLFRKSNWWVMHISPMNSLIPIFGALLKKIYLARFASSMHLLLSSKNPLDKSLGLVSEMIGFYPLKKALEASRLDIQNGMSLHQSLKKHSFFQSQLLSIIKVGEESNRLEFVFQKLASEYSDEIDKKTETLRSVIEPILIIFIGGFVALILVAMYLPLFKLGTTIH
jgi:type IV pilus assembly protein PilC